MCQTAACRKNGDEWIVRFSFVRSFERSRHAPADLAVAVQGGIGRGLATRRRRRAADEDVAVAVGRRGASSGTKHGHRAREVFGDDPEGILQNRTRRIVDVVRELRDLLVERADTIALMAHSNRPHMSVDVSKVTKALHKVTQIRTCPT